MNRFLPKLFLILFIAFLLSPTLVFSQEKQAVYLTIFWGDGCPHCKKEFLFLDKLEKEYPNLKIRKLEVWYNHENGKRLREVGEKLNIKSATVPLTLVGQEVISGYLDDKTTGERIKEIVKQQGKEGSIDVVGEIIKQNELEKEIKPPPPDLPETISLPFFGQVSLKNWSLPMLTVAIGTIDGFNPCAMWTLLFLISLLLGMADRKKMWALGSTFIFVSGLVYFLFLAAWLNLFLFLGFIGIIRISIGLVAIGSGIYHLREWQINKSGVCRATDEERRQKIMDKLRKIAQQKTFWLALLGIAFLAFAVNLIELVCSAGLPAIYTQILSLAELPTLQYYAYLLLYIFFYILDDLIVFIVAMTTFQAFGLSVKYSRWANLFGGIIILILGILLIFKPGWIMFG